MEIKPLKYKQLKGISQKQLSEHHDVLYAGYINKYKEIDKSLAQVDLATSNGTYSEIRELNVEKTFALNGIKLHEGYFEGMTDKSLSPNGLIKKLIERDFGSFENWRNEFAALGLAARGWVVLSYDLDSKKLCNFVCDAHNQGGVWNNIAIIILDVYEHAYFLDYQTSRKAYIEAYMQNIDWDEINNRFKRYNLA